MFMAQFASIWRNHKLQQNALLAVTSTAISVLIGFSTAPILAHLLPREDYGILSYVSSLQGLILAFSVPGVANAISYSVARGYDGVFRIATYYRFRIYFRNSILLLPLAGWYLWFQKNPSLASLVLLSGLLLPFLYAFDTGEQFLVGRWDFAAIFWRRVLGKFFMAGSGIIAAYLIPTAFSVLLSRGVVTAGVTIAIFFLLTRSTRNDDIDPQFWTKSKGFGQVSVLCAIGNLVDRLVLGMLSTMSLLAGYSLALAITAPLTELSKSFIKIAFGKMTQERGTQQRRFWVMLSLSLVGVGIPLMLISWRAVLPIVSRLFPKYSELGQIVPILIVAAIVGFGADLGQTYSLFHSYKLWKVYNMIRNGSKIPIMAGAVLFAGIWGALYTQVVYSLVDFVTYNVLLWHEGSPDVRSDIELHNAEELSTHLA